MMGCRSLEGEEVVVGSEDMKPGILCGGIFIHLQFFFFFLSGIPLIIGIQSPRLPIISCHTINATNIFFPGPPPRGNRNHH